MACLVRVRDRAWFNLGIQEAERVCSGHWSLAGGLTAGPR